MAEAEGGSLEDGRGWTARGDLADVLDAVVMRAKSLFDDFCKDRGVGC